MSFTPENILKALSTVEEPDLKKDLVTLNMIRDVKVEDNKVEDNKETNKVRLRFF